MISGPAAEGTISPVMELMKSRSGGIWGDDPATLAARDHWNGRGLKVLSNLSVEETSPEPRGMTGLFHCSPI